MAGWFIWWNSEAVGPMDSERLTGLIERGQLVADDWIWHEDLGEWRQLRMLGVFPSARPAPDNGRARVFGAADDAGRWQPDDDGGSLDAPSLTAIYLKRLGRQADHANTALFGRNAGAGRTMPGDGAAQPRNAGPQPPSLPIT